MRTHHLPATLTLSAMLVVALSFGTAGQVTGPTRPPLIIPSLYGQDLYNYYCASCHGRDGKGGGPVAAALTVLPPDLTTLAARHGGAFPREFVESFVVGNRDPLVPAHGSKDMPVWGPIFLALDPNPAVNKVRIDNIVSYIASMQSKS